QLVTRAGKGRDCHAGSGARGRLSTKAVRRGELAREGSENHRLEDLRMPWRPAPGPGAPRHSARGYEFLVADTLVVAVLPPLRAGAREVIAGLLRPLTSKGGSDQVPGTGPNTAVNGPTVCVPSVTSTCTAAPTSAVPEIEATEPTTGFATLVMA